LIEKHLVFLRESIMLKRRSKNLIVASGLAMALTSLSATYAVGASTQSIADVRQEVQIWTSYALNPYLRVNNLQASVKDGKATLTGKVQEGLSKELANEIALGVDGIKEVDNQITVVTDLNDEDLKPFGSYGEGIEDATITATVKSKLMWSKHTSGLKTSVVTKSGRVSLTGSADSSAAKKMAGSIAMNTRGVVSVNNALIITKPAASDKETVATVAAEAEQTITDSWITAKVKLTLLYSSNVAGTDVHVTTEAGVVTLKGSLSSGEEKALAVELTQNVIGVKSVEAGDLTFSG